MATRVMIKQDMGVVETGALAEPPIWQDVRHAGQRTETERGYQDDHAGDAAIARQPVTRQAADRD